MSSGSHASEILDVFKTSFLASFIIEEIFFPISDSAYRERFERLRREAEFSKKKLHQEHEEELEEFEAAKKLLERKACSDIDFISVLLHMPGYFCRNTACMFYFMLIEEEAW